MPTLAPNAGGNAFQLGWVMAGLYGRFSRAHDRSAGHLPTLGELDATDRMRLAVMEVTVRLEQLRPAIDIPGTARPLEALDFESPPAFLEPPRLAAPAKPWAASR